MAILVTGGAGFIGANFVFHMLEKYPDYEIVNLDALTYCGNLENLFFHVKHLLYFLPAHVLPHLYCNVNV